MGIKKGKNSNSNVCPISHRLQDIHNRAIRDGRTYWLHHRITTFNSVGMVKQEGQNIWPDTVPKSKFSFRIGQGKVEMSQF